MSEKVYDPQGHLKYEITSGPSQRVTDAHGNYVGNRDHRGNIVTPSGAVVDRVPPKK